MTRQFSAVLDQALTSLETARRAEGAALATVLAAHVDEIEGLTLRAEADPSREPSAIRARLVEQVRLLLDVSVGLDEQRLHAEAAFLATKADIREEIDRLKTHVGVRSGAAGGRRAGRPEARFSGAGIQSRIEYIVLQIKCSRGDGDRP